MSHRERKWECARTYLRLPVCPGFGPSVQGLGAIRIRLQLFSVELEAGRSIRGFYGPRSPGGDVDDFSPSIILASCHDLARNKNRPRQLAVGAQVRISKYGQLLDHHPFGAKPIDKPAFHKSREIVADPAGNLGTDICGHDLLTPGFTPRARRSPRSPWPTSRFRRLCRS
jgi:hypothetical protein